jgi:hypothetical protein
LPASQCARFCSFHTTVRQGLRGCVSHRCAATSRPRRAPLGGAAVARPAGVLHGAGRAAAKAGSSEGQRSRVQPQRGAGSCTLARRDARRKDGEGLRKGCRALTRAWPRGASVRIMGLASAVGPLASAACCLHCNAACGCEPRLRRRCKRPHGAW